MPSFRDVNAFVNTQRMSSGAVGDMASLASQLMNNKQIDANLMRMSADMENAYGTELVPKKKNKKGEEEIDKDELVNRISADAGNMNLQGAGNFFLSMWSVMGQGSRMPTSLGDVTNVVNNFVSKGENRESLTNAFVNCAHAAMEAGVNAANDGKFSFSAAFNGFFNKASECLNEFSQTGKVEANPEAKDSAAGKAAEAFFTHGLDAIQKDPKMGVGTFVSEFVAATDKATATFHHELENQNANKMSPKPQPGSSSRTDEEEMRALERFSPASDGSGARGASGAAQEEKAAANASQRPGASGPGANMSDPAASLKSLDRE